ncbi:hypothetical protein TSAR_001411 [Trichomalopsis sarcophagae]|uniref:Endonuclease/exonuclease/phosphatase domain-containing protein n=1 Tax=Trichomalopsis sarcophagae TaxID=543379 RepID=A0A232EHJ5_9HYME|nr:hypothetical protein TSAR_001411 [Trichomalopsis sarcophagae]
MACKRMQETCDSLVGAPRSNLLQSSTQVPQLSYASVTRHSNSAARKILLDQSKPINIVRAKRITVSPCEKDIHDLILRSKSLVFGISESFLQPSDSSAREQIPGDTFFRHDRLGKRTGVYASRGYSVQHKFLCVLVYSPPKAGYWRYVEEAVLNCNSPCDQLLLIRDLNIEWHGNSASRNILEQSLRTLGLVPAPFGKTHHLDQSESTIDYICIPQVCRDVSHWQLHLPYYYHNRRPRRACEYFCRNDAPYIIKRINAALANVVSLAKANGLRINGKKTKATWFGSRGFEARLNRQNLPPIVVDGQNI